MSSASSPNTLTERTTTCPLCFLPCKIYSPLSSAYKVLGRDSDFLANYEGANPLFYEVWVCSYCNFASFREDFAKVMDHHMKACLEVSEESRKGPKTDFSKPERTLFTALASYRLALKYYQARKASHETLAAVNLRLAKLCRIGKDRPRELSYSQAAMEHYQAAYDLPSDNSAGQMALLPYMIGELAYRIGDVQEAIDWFNRVITLSEKQPVRGDLMYYTKEQLAKAQQSLERVNLLRQVPFLTPLTDRELGRLEAECRLMAVDEGASVFKPGDEPDGMAVVLSGEVTERTGDSEAVYGPGESFGELSLLTGEPRGSEAVASTDTEILVVEKGPFRQLLAANPDLSAQLIQAFATMSRKVPAAGDVQQQHLFEKLLSFFKLPGGAKTP